LNGERFDKIWAVGRNLQLMGKAYAKGMIFGGNVAPKMYKMRIAE